MAGNNTLSLLHHVPEAHFFSKKKDIFSQKKRKNNVFGFSSSETLLRLRDQRTTERQMTAGKWRVTKVLRKKKLFRFSFSLFEGKGSKESLYLNLS